MQLLSALYYMHEEKQVVHRDISSNNILIGIGHRIKITDFGLATKNQQSMNCSFVGTLM